MKKSVLIKLYAGLGNQLFQYIYGHYLSKNGTKVKFLQDTKVDDLNSVFVIDKKTLKECKYIRPNKIFAFILKFYHKICCRNYYTGYYQDKKYALDLGVDLQEILQFKNAEEYKKTKEYQEVLKSESVSLHIRGGDYNKEPDFANICTKEYYAKAIGKILEKLPNASFFVFTNDIQYAKNITQNFENMIYLNNDTFKRDPGFDLFLMTICKHSIIANSTFSWWGACLNFSVEQFVICPKEWKNSEPDLIDKFAFNECIKI